MRGTRLLVGALIAATLAGTAHSGEAAGCWSPRYPEKFLAKVTNGDRDRFSLRAVRFDPDLAKVARTHSWRMAKRGYLYHSDPATLSRQLVPGTWGVVNENVGHAEDLGAVKSDLRRLERSFMASASHRANILDAGNLTIGVGIVERNGRYWTTVLFAERPDPETTLRMTSC